MLLVEAPAVPIGCLCPNCLEPLQFPDERAGCSVNCPKCGTPFTCRKPPLAKLAEQPESQQPRRRSAEDVEPQSTYWIMGISASVVAMSLLILASCLFPWPTLLCSIAIIALTSVLLFPQARHSVEHALGWRPPSGVGWIVGMCGAVVVSVGLLFLSVSTIASNYRSQAEAEELASKLAAARLAYEAGRLTEAEESLNALQTSGTPLSVEADALMSQVQAAKKAVVIAQAKAEAAGIFRAAESAIEQRQ